MKQNHLKGIAGIALILALALAACESPTSGSGSSGGSSTVTRELGSVTYESKDTATGDVYKLTIDEDPNRGRYAGRDGDLYTLLITFADATQKTSKGTITKGGDKFILTANNAPFVLLWVILSNTGLTKIHGRITFEGPNDSDYRDASNLTLTPPPPPPPPGSHVGADSLSVSGGVWKEAGSGLDALFGEITYVQITDNLTIDDGGLGGTGAITGGNLSYQIGVPATLGVLLDTLTPMLNNEIMQWDNITITPAAATGANLQLLTTIDGDQYDLERSEQAGSVMTGGTFKGVRYIYADQDVAFKGTGKTFTSDSLFGSITSSTKSFNLQLKRGWNAVFLEGKVQGFGVKDAKLSLKDPADVRWTVDEVND